MTLLNREGIPDATQANLYGGTSQDSKPSRLFVLLQPSAKIDYQGFFGDVFFHAVPAETKQVENQIVEQSFFKVGSNSELAESPQH